jgi:hypothetical protein
MNFLFKLNKSINKPNINFFSKELFILLSSNKDEGTVKFPKNNYINVMN